MPLAMAATKGLLTLEDVLETLLGLEIVDEGDRVTDMLRFQGLDVDDQGLVGHNRQIGTTCDTRAENGGDLIDPLGRKPRVVVEDAPEMVTVGKNIVLHRQEDPG